MITRELLKLALHYDPESGLFTWRSPRRRIRVGQRAGSPHNEGYEVIAIDGRKYYSHRLAWLYVYGQMPENDNDIDHINGNRSDNRIVNLRSATRSQNLLNSSPHEDSRTSIKNITFDPKRERWVLQISAHGKKKIIKRFKSKEEAIKFRAEIIRSMHGEFAR